MPTGKFTFWSYRRAAIKSAWAEAKLWSAFKKPLGLLLIALFVAVWRSLNGRETGLKDALMIFGSGIIGGLSVWGLEILWSLIQFPHQSANKAIEAESTLEGEISELKEVERIRVAKQPQKPQLKFCFIKQPLQYGNQWRFQIGVKNASEATIRNVIVQAVSIVPLGIFKYNSFPEPLIEDRSGHGKINLHPNEERTFSVFHWGNNLFSLSVARDALTRLDCNVDLILPFTVELKTFGDDAISDSISLQCQWDKKSKMLSVEPIP